MRSALLGRGEWTFGLVERQDRESMPRWRTHAEKPGPARPSALRLRGARRDLFREPSSDKGRHFGVAAAQAMVTALDVVEGHGARNEPQGELKLGWRAEGVSAARDEQARKVETPKMVGAHVVGPAGRVERVADKHEAGGWETFGNSDAAHTPSHGAPSQEDPLRCQGIAGSQ